MQTCWTLHMPRAVNVKDICCGPVTYALDRSCVLALSPALRSGLPDTSSRLGVFCSQSGSSIALLVTGTTQQSSNRTAGTTARWVGQVPKESVKGGCSEHVVTSLACQHTFSDRAAEKLSPDQAIEGPVQEDRKVNFTVRTRNPRHCWIKEGEIWV